ncbi:MAG: NAD-binding protein [Candidatus Brocadiia bacterium]
MVRPVQDTSEEVGVLARLWRRFVQRGRPDYKWVVIGALWLVAFVLGYIGFARRAELVGQSLSRLDIGYLSLQLFTMESGAVEPPVPTTLEVARYLAPAVAAVTALKALLLIFRRQYERWRLRRWKGHVIVCGLGSKGRLLVEGFLRRGRRVAAVESNPDNENIEPCREMGALTLTGDAADPEILRRVGLAGARHLLAVTGDDGVNVQIAANARQARADAQDVPLTAVVHLVDPDHCRLLRRQEVTSGGASGVRLRFFNVYHAGARRLLAEYPLVPDESAGARPAHLLIVGSGELARSIILEAGRQWAPRCREGGEKLHITVAAPEADRLAQALREQHPDVDEVCRLEGRPVATTEFGYEGLERVCRTKEMADIRAAFVCLTRDADCLPAAIAVNRALADTGAGADVVAVLSQGGGLAAVLEAGGDDEFARLHPFRLLEHTCTPEIVLDGTHERLARGLHRQYVHQQEEAEATPESNPHLVPWDELPEWLRESNRRQADHVSIKLQEIDCQVQSSADWDHATFEFTPEEVERLARLEHKRWVSERRLQGWRKGPEKDDEEKISPYLVDWRDLPEEVKEVDRAFIRGLPRMLAEAGLRIRRR